MKFSLVLLLFLNLCIRIFATQISSNTGIQNYTVGIKSTKNDFYSSTADTVCKFHLNNKDVYDDLFLSSQYCQISYCIHSNALSKGKLNFKTSSGRTLKSEIVEIWGGSVQGIILINFTSKQIVIVFKGTTELEEWFVDFDFFLTPYQPWTIQYGKSKSEFNCGGCQAHSGFYKASKAFVQQALPQVLKLSHKYSDYKIVLTGHSLGGALAVFGAVELRLMGLETNVVTFAAPKFANTKFSHWLDGYFNTRQLINQLEYSTIQYLPHNSYTRVVHRGDIVPLLPFKEMDFAHAGCGVYIKKVELPHDLKDICVRGQWNSETEAANIDDDVRARLSKCSYQSIYWKHMVTVSHLDYLVHMDICPY